jgi:hypothetical protein
MAPTSILVCMIAAYLAPIAFVYYKYKVQAQETGTRSISSIITSIEPFLSFTPDTYTAASTAPPLVFQTRHFIALCMLIMAGFTVLYEYQRQRWSLAAILVLLCGIFGVIFIPEQNPTHYIFAAAAFVAIIGFMCGHTFNHTSTHDIHETLRMLLYAQFLFTLVTIIGVIQETAIFAAEALFLLNFAVFYLYLHYHTFSSPPS